MKKQHLLLLLLPLFIAACKPKATEAPAASTTTPAYPYTIKHPDYWMIDTSHTNTMVALTALKSFETMDTATIKKCFTDSIDFKHDGGEFKGTVSQFAKMAADMAATMKNMKIDMKDWEAVVSTDKKEEWVTLWYTQKWTGAKGVTDSIELVNDMQFKNGKIIKLNEYIRNVKPAK